MATHPTLTDGDPEGQDPSTWSTDDLLATAEELAVWHDRSRVLGDSESWVQHGLAAEVIRELMGRVPPFEWSHRTPWKDGKPVPGKTVVEIAGHTISRRLYGVPWVDRALEPDPVSRAILEACERDHENERSESDD